MLTGSACSSNSVIGGRSHISDGPKYWIGPGYWYSVLRASVSRIDAYFRYGPPFRLTNAFLMTGLS